MPSGRLATYHAEKARIGEAHPAARLTEAAVRRIRQDAARVLAARRGGRRRRDGAPFRAPLHATDVFARAAVRYGVSRAAVCMAAYGRTWAHVPGALPAPTAPAR